MVKRIDGMVKGLLHKFQAITLAIALLLLLVPINIWTKVTASVIIVLNILAEWF